MLLQSLAALAALEILASPAFAEPVRLICKTTDPGQAWRWEVRFDLEAWTFQLQGEEWELSAGDEKLLAARTLNKNWPSTVLIDRETGELWKTSVGGFCRNEECTLTWNGVLEQHATCSVPF